MAENKRFAKASWAIMAQLLKVENLEEALSGSLEIIVKTLNSEAGAIWLLDKKDRPTLTRVPHRTRRYLQYQRGERSGHRGYRDPDG